MYQTTTITPNVGGSSLNLGYSYYDPQPEAHITKSKNRLKLYSGSTVYLKDESTFEIELYNPKPVRVLAKISLNGLHISGGGIIVNPGQRVYLERFIDEDRRFKFSTYEVEDSDETRQAIEKNGEVRVEFYSELNLGTQYMQYSSFTAPPVYAGSTVNTLFNTSASLTSSVTYDASVKGSMETGRVEKGSRSSQELAAGFGSFNSWACAVYHYKILPTSHKPVEVGEIRSYCTGCGTRIKKSNWKFCPSCGTEILA